MTRRLGPVWTHRFNEIGRPAQHKLFDHIWLSGPLADRQDELAHTLKAAGAGEQPASSSPSTRGETCAQGAITSAPWRGSSVRRREGCRR
jgi:hypothetical protein